MKFKYLLGIIFLATTLVWLAVFSYPDKKLKIIICDVGQGDAILMVYGNFQILTDGGPGNKVLECLSKYIPFWDREIEIVILTHPQADHYTGLIEVFRRYSVKTFVNNSLDSSSQSYKVLENEVEANRSQIVLPRQGKSIRYEMIQLDILHPLQEIQETKINNPNDVSIVYKLKFKDFEAIFTGDAGPEIFEKLLKSDLVGPVDYIKIPHHGSINGITREFLDIAKPKIAVISVGKNNSYGHPKKEILDMLFSIGAKVLRTDVSGDIFLETDGENLEVD